MLVSSALLVTNHRPAHSTGFEAKLDPMLRLALDRPDTDGLAGLMAVTDDAGTIEVVLHARRDITSQVEALGGTVQTVLGDGAVMTAALPRAAVRTLASDPDVLGIDASKVLYQMAAQTPGLAETGDEPQPLAVSVGEIRAPLVWAQTDKRGLPIRGAGVLVGIMDSGIDTKHGDFKDPAGGTRIVTVWDQLATGSGLAGTSYRYGVECTPPMLTAGTCASSDPGGHGTHVAGIAAGNGLSTTPAKHIGVAPDASLIVVRRGRTTTSTNAIIDGWTYMVSRAKLLGLPIVINNSWGHGLGAKDGSDPLERALDLLAGPGVIFVNAVGNAGERRAHAEGTVRAGSTVSLPFTLAVPNAQNLVVATVWYRGADSLGVSVKTAQGQVLGPVAKGASRSWTNGEGTQVTIDASRAFFAGNGDNQVLVAVERPTPPLATNWELLLHGDQVVTSGRFDSWLASSISGSGAEDFTSAAGTLTQTMGEPSTAKRTISVGNYVSSRCFVSVDTKQYCLNGISETGGAHPSTSRGPTRDGREKPELAAPGATILSALSIDSEARKPGHPDGFLRSTDGLHIAQIGTSMAAPHVTGVVALMLQKQPTLTPEEVRVALQTTARTDVKTGQGWNAVWGRGKLDALGAVNAITAPVVRPAAPAAVMPLADARLEAMQANLSWTNPAGATQIHLQVTPAGNDGPAINLIRNAETSFAVERPELGAGPYVLLPGMTYRWRVRASAERSAIDEQNASWGDWSEQRAFRTPPRTSDRISAVSPALGASTTAMPQTLRWQNADTDVFYYEVQASPDPNFETNPALATASVWSNLVHAGLTTPPNAWTTPPLQPGTVYYWRLRPRVQGDGTPVAWSQTFSFRTD